MGAVFGEERLDIPLEIGVGGAGRGRGNEDADHRGDGVGCRALGRTHDVKLGTVPIGKSRRNDPLMIASTTAPTTTTNAASTGFPVGWTPGSIQSISVVWVNEITISSTIWLSPTVRETAVIFTSGGSNLPACPAAVSIVMPGADAHVGTTVPCRSPTPAPNPAGSPVERGLDRGPRTINGRERGGDNRTDSVDRPDSVGRTDSVDRPDHHGIPESGRCEAAVEARIPKAIRGKTAAIEARAAEADAAEPHALGLCWPGNREQSTEHAKGKHSPHHAESLHESGLIQIQPGSRTLHDARKKCACSARGR
jgi:hypothetical protein